MQISISGLDGSHRSVDELIAEARQFEADGFPAYCLNNVFAVDALTVLAVIGREVPRIELSAAVVPVYGRHPVVMAQQALMVQNVSQGRLTLGLGLSHKLLVEQHMGLSFERPVEYMREYVSALSQLLRKRMCMYNGERLEINTRITVPERRAPSVLLGALGSKMLALAGELADGTITFLTGPRTLREHTIPTITAAAERAGRPAPRVVCHLPICVTDDVVAAKRRGTKEYRMYDVLPSYKAMLTREGLRGPADAALIGDEATVAAAVLELESIGVTDFVAHRFGSNAEQDRTRLLLKSLLEEGVHEREPVAT